MLFNAAAAKDEVKSLIRNMLLGSLRINKDFILFVSYILCD